MAFIDKSGLNYPAQLNFQKSSFCSSPPISNIDGSNQNMILVTIGSGNPANLMGKEAKDGRKRAREAEARRKRAKEAENGRKRANKSMHYCLDTKIVQS